MLEIPSRAEGGGFDLIVVGGGVQGISIALEAARRGQRPLVIERDVAGAHTSRNWYRILHGGLRYLQSLDVGRLRASVLERRWFLRHFPDLARPMPFLMPLYGTGLKRPASFRLALAALAMLSPERNRGVPATHRIGPGQILDAAATVALYPDVVRPGLKGGALWEDAVAPDDELLFGALVEWARAAGAAVVEGREADGLVTAGGRVSGLVVRDRATGRTERYAAPVVLNAAGPWSGEVAARLDRSIDHLLPLALAFNLTIDRPAPAQLGLAISPPASSGPTLFLYPRGSKTFAGTWHAPWDGGPTQGMPDVPEPEIDAFLEALSRAAPSFVARRRDVVAVHAGLQPAAGPGSREASHRDIIHDHAAAGGPAGFYTIVPVKFTTSRRVSERVLSMLFTARGETLPPYRSDACRPILSRAG